LHQKEIVAQIVLFRDGKRMGELRHIRNTPFLIVIGPRSLLHRSAFCLDAIIISSLRVAVKERQRADFSALFDGS
jgi:hypothetical protein